MPNIPKNINKPISAPSGSQTSTGKLMTTKASEGSDWNSKNDTGEYVSQPGPRGAVGGKNTGGAG
jgi:hypothetical protein